MRHTRVIVTEYGGPDAMQVIEEELARLAGREMNRLLAAVAQSAYGLRAAGARAGGPSGPL